jgi:transposase
MLLLPQSVQDWVPAGDMAHFIGEVVDVFDLSAIENAYEGDLRGYPPYHPRMMTKLWMYAYAVGTTSSRKVARLAQRDVGFMMLAAGNKPDHRTLSDFRLRHLQALRSLFMQVLRLCQKKDLLQGKHVAIDGTKVKANASKHSAMSYGRMKQEEQHITKEIDDWFDETDRVDADEDGRYGRDKSGDELPEELQTAEGRRKAIHEAMEELEREAKEAGKAEPDDKAQRNFTDPESRIMRGGDGSFIQGYNAQAAVDAKKQIIVATDLTPMASDAPQLIPMVDRVRKNLGRNPDEISADAGYCSEANLAKLSTRDVEPYIATGKGRRSYRLPTAPRGRIPQHLTLRERMSRKLLTKHGRSRYRLRQQVVEPVFGQIKNKGLVRFLLRGEEKCSAEWDLHCIGHNLSKLHQAWGRPHSPRCSPPAGVRAGLPGDFSHNPAFPADASTFMPRLRDRQPLLGRAAREDWRALGQGCRRCADGGGAGVPRQPQAPTRTLIASPDPLMHWLVRTVRPPRRIGNC